MRSLLTKVVFAMCDERGRKREEEREVGEGERGEEG